MKLVREHFAMDGKVRGGDVIVCRVNGTCDFYVVGTVVSGNVGELSLCGVSMTVGQDAALGRDGNIGRACHGNNQTQQPS